MELVIDANILFSALIKKGVTRELMLNDELNLFTPEYIIDEFFEHISGIENKIHSRKYPLVNVLEELLTESKLSIVPLDDIRPYIAEARKISPDLDDALYFAAALKLKCGIWSNDKKLKNQKYVDVYATYDLIKML